MSLSETFLDIFSQFMSLLLSEGQKTGNDRHQYRYFDGIFNEIRKRFIGSRKYTVAVSQAKVKIS